MAGADSTDVNERLNGLISILQSAGIDGLDSDVLLNQQKKARPKKKSVDNGGISSNDAEILELVKKLKQAQADSPEIGEALKSPELLALVSLAATKQGVQAAPEPPKPAATSLDDVFDVDDDNYPKIGPGYSDDVSVVSELSTPTVMTRQSIEDEEYYSEVGTGGQGGVPSMAGGLAGGRLARPNRAIPNRAGLGAGTFGGGKNKNKIVQVRPLTARRSMPAIPSKPSGGAAAQRRLNYQMAMSKLESDGFGSPKSDGSQPLSPPDKEPKAPVRTVSGTRSIGSGSGGGSKRKPRSISKLKNKSGNDINWGATDDDGWPAFDDLKNNASTSELFVDSDGFFSDNVFASNATTKSRRKKGDGSTGSGGKKKSREERASRKGRSKKDRDSERERERAYSDDDREGSTRKSRLKDKEKDALSDDGIGTSRKNRKSRKDKDKDREKERDKEKSKRRARRATMAT